MFTVEALECFLEFVPHKIWVDDHTYEYIAVAMQRNDRTMGQKQLPIFRVSRKMRQSRVLQTMYFSVVGLGDLHGEGLYLQNLLY